MGRIECGLLGAGASLHYPDPMIYQFDTYELDLDRGELRAGGEPCAVEPQVFALLSLLVQNRERLVSHDELIEKVWDGRVVSDSAISSRIKMARQALSDDGKAQRFIRTVHRRGFRFVAEVRVLSGPPRIDQPADTAGAAEDATAPDPVGRPSIAVLPLRLLGDPGPYAAIADALPHELIAELARLRWLFVIARGSTFRLRGAETDPIEIGRLLGARYCLAGTLEVTVRRLAVTLELIDTRDGGLVWAESFAGAVDDVHQLREDIRTRLLAALEIQIPLHEAAQARLTVTESLDAWSAYHLGLQHVYRFNRSDNAEATRLFEHAIQLDPAFARAHAGLSFVHFQTAFMHHTDDVAGERELARRYAMRGLELDPLDPFVNFTMGRTYWLEGDLETGLSWLERATSLSPNYAQGHYARSWTEALSGKLPLAHEHADLAMRLSPLDPLYYAMLGARALACMSAGDDANAAAWGERAGRSPGSHVLVAMITLVGHALAGNNQQAAAWAENVRRRNPALTRQDFFRAFPMKSPTARARMDAALAQYGF
jgi:DNA-binding winged helix-turn-helix (wHTH) protein/tetratricopeptide (TPR) repeat protein